MFLYGFTHLRMQILVTPMFNFKFKMTKPIILRDSRHTRWVIYFEEKGRTPMMRNS